MNQPTVDEGELRLALRSFLRHASFVRRVWIVTSGSTQARGPAWLREELRRSNRPRVLVSLVDGDALVREAGGFVSDFASRDRVMHSGDVVAANPSLHAELLKLLARARDK